MAKYLLFVRIINNTAHRIKYEEILNQRTLLDNEFGKHNISIILTVDNEGLYTTSLDITTGLNKLAPWKQCNPNTNICQEPGSLEPKHVFIYVVNDIPGDAFLARTSPTAICGVSINSFKTESIGPAIIQAMGKNQYIYDSSRYPNLSRDDLLKRSGYPP